MSEDNEGNGIKSPHGLVIFENEPESAKKEEESYAFENIDQENAIKLLSESAPFASHYRYSILLANESLAPITDVKTKIKYPNFMDLVRISPPSVEIKPNSNISDKKTKQVALEFPKLPEKTKKQLNLYFSPTTIKGEGEIVTVVTFVNAQDYVRVLNSDPINIIIQPINIEPKIVPSNYLDPFSKRQGIKKAIKSIGLAIEEEPNFGLIFNHMEQILKQHNFQVIAKDEKKMIVWTFGRELESKQEIMMIGQIISNKIEFLGACMNHQILIPVLTQLVDDLAKRLVGLTIIPDQNQIFELDCRYCGMILPRFPLEGEPVKCTNCKKENIIW